MNLLIDKRPCTFFLVILMLLSFKVFSQESAFTKQINIIPKPGFLEKKTGEFVISFDFRILIEKENAEAKAIAEYLAKKLKNSLGLSIVIKQASIGKTIKNSLKLVYGDSAKNLGNEGYELTIEQDAMVLIAQKPAGLFYGIQTILQLLPPEIESKTKITKNIEPTLPCLTIRDVPRYPYRGMHLDVCRHFFPVSFIKKYIDLLALHKINTFHWHLTEDQGWRIEIKKYPKLTEVGSCREETLIGSLNNYPIKYDGKPVCGFYTQEEIKEIVQYAKKHYVTIVPEIEMPGHAMAALASYPELSCTGGSFKVATRWGIYQDVYCAGNEAVFTFLEDVLSEVIDLFPGKYIHIGGDECLKARWEKCEKCQARIKTEKLKDEHELQSYFIQRIEKFLLSKDRKLIGWDEILEGGLAPEATVMSWRGMQGGIEAAKQKHDVIMTPTSHCYFDYYQGDPETEPLAIGGLLPLKTVYSLEPTPPELSPEEEKRILGAQGNVWTEYIATPEHAEYMSVSRMAALAEVVWSPKSARHWKDFRRRLNFHFRRLDLMDVNYSKGSFIIDIIPDFDEIAKTSSIVLDTEQYNADIRYTLDGTEPSISSPKYKNPFPFEHTIRLKTKLYIDGNPAGKVCEKSIVYNKATNKDIKLINAFRSRLSGGGERALIDGITGSKTYFDGKWQGFEQVDLIAVIDLLESLPVKKITTRFLQQIGARIFFPKQIEFSLSDDNTNFQHVAIFKNTLSQNDSMDVNIKEFSQNLVNKKARYVRVVGKNIGWCPDWHWRPGNIAFVVADEIIIE